MLNTATFKEVFSATIEYLVDRIHNNYAFQIIPNSFLANPNTSATFATILVNFLLGRLKDMGSKYYVGQQKFLSFCINNIKIETWTSWYIRNTLIISAQSIKKRFFGEVFIWLGHLIARDVFCKKQFSLHEVLFSLKFDLSSFEKIYFENTLRIGWFLIPKHSCSRNRLVKKEFYPCQYLMEELVCICVCGSFY